MKVGKNIANDAKESILSSMYIELAKLNTETSKLHEMGLYVRESEASAKAFYWLKAIQFVSSVEV